MLSLVPSDYTPLQCGYNGEAAGEGRTIQFCDESGLPFGVKPMNFGEEGAKLESEPGLKRGDFVFGDDDELKAEGTIRWEVYSLVRAAEAMRDRLGKEGEKAKIKAEKLAKLKAEIAAKQAEYDKLMNG